MKSKLIRYDTENWERVCQIIFSHVDAKTCPAFSEAVAYIRVRIEQCEGRTWDENNSTMHRAFVTSQFLWPDSFWEDFIRKSEISARYFDILNEICAILSEDGREFPTLLAKWLSKRLRGEVKRPRKKSDTKNSERNFLICQFVNELENLGFSATRNTDGTNPTSACDIIAVAYGMSYDAIKSVYFNNRTGTPV